MPAELPNYDKTPLVIKMTGQEGDEETIHTNCGLFTQNPTIKDNTALAAALHVSVAHLKFMSFYTPTCRAVSPGDKVCPKLEASKLNPTDELTLTAQYNF